LDTPAGLETGLETSHPDFDPEQKAVHIFTYGKDWLNTSIKSEAYQLDVFGDGSLTRIKSIRWKGGNPVDTNPVTTEIEEDATWLEQEQQPKSCAPTHTSTCTTDADKWDTTLVRTYNTADFTAVKSTVMQWSGKELIDTTNKSVTYIHNYGDDLKTGGAFSADDSYIKQIQLALELYFDSQSNKYPAVIADVVTNNYLPTEPKDPLNGVAYTYFKCSDTAYHLGATMEQSGGSALASDADKDSACAGDTVDGISTAAACGADAAATAITDLCYDVIP